jgi:hypothetical protein
MILLNEENMSDEKSKQYVRQDDGAVINTNNAELNTYLEARRRLRDKEVHEKKLSDLEDKVKSLDDKLQVILDHITKNQTGK